MRFTNLFSKTLRDDQKDADAVSHNLLLRAGYIRQLASGIFSYLHFGQRCMRKIEKILRNEMDNIGGDGISIPKLRLFFYKLGGVSTKIRKSFGEFFSRNASFYFFIKR